MNEPLRYACGCCSWKLRPIPASDHATQVVRRTCRKCGNRWQVIVDPLAVREGMRMDKGTLTPLGRKAGR